VKSKRFIVYLTILTVAVGGCTSTQQSNEFNRKTLTFLPEDLGTDAGSDIYREAEPKFAGVDSQVNEVPSDGVITNNSDTSFQSFMAEQAQNVNCIQTGELAIEYSAISAKQSGTASITDILDSRLTEDWTTTAQIPAAGEKVPLLKCAARVRWSIDFESDVNLWLLLDSDRNLRVRWDNITNAIEIGTSNL